MSIDRIIESFQNKITSDKSLEIDSIHSTIEVINLCQNCLNSLRNYIDNEGFKSSGDEIHFFKVQKQIPQSELVYQVTLKNFYFNIPKGGQEAQILYCNNRLNRINDFFAKHKEFDKYARLARTDLDKYYFTRPTQDVHFECYEPFYRDPIFCSARDLTLSKLSGYQKFIDFLIDYKYNLIHPDDKHIILKSKFKPLKWTGSKVALTELVYALYSSHIINNGNLEIKDIASLFANVFNYDLGDFYKTYSEIKARKISRTKFLDDLSAGLLSQMDKSEI